MNLEQAVMKSETEANSLKQHILVELRRLAESNDGKAPGQRSFEAETGITRSSWRGKYWATWSDAVSEAGLEPNFAPERAAESDIVSFLVSAVRYFGRFPSEAELRIYRQSQTEAPAIVTIRKQFPTRESMIAGLLELAKTESVYSDLTDILPEVLTETNSVSDTTIKGWVYLLQSGQHYKIGRSESLERRIRQISIALPESVVMVHAISTDDTPGIEAYWHKRFASRRANGEWFKLGPIDIAAFKKRKSM
jgi:hypothetical protein